MDDRGQVERLDRIFEQLETKAKGKKCKGMEGLVAEGQEMMDEDFEDDLMDAALISAAQRVERGKFGYVDVKGGRIEGQLGTLERPFDPTIRIPSKKTLARLSNNAVSK